MCGIRQDAWANKHRITVEEQKSDAERGYFLHPDLYEQPDERHVEWGRRPEVMKRIKEARSQGRVGIICSQVFQELEQLVTSSIPDLLYRQFL